MFVLLLNAAVVLWPWGTAEAASIATSNQEMVDAFVAGAVGPVGFDGPPGNAFQPGSLVATANAIDDDLQSIGLLFSSTGGPTVAVNYAPDAKSDPNVLGGTSLSQSSKPVVDYTQPVDIRFVIRGTTTPSTTDLIGAWNDPTGSIIKLEVFDADDKPIESVQANQGQFLGIQAPGIARATFTFLQVQSQPGFTVDDLFFAATVPQCGDPVNDATFATSSNATPALIVASDALFVLRTAVGTEVCDLCVCDVNHSLTITASDAQITLRRAVSQPVELNCPSC
jgi:hypothetical protein